MGSYTLKMKVVFTESPLGGCRWPLMYVCVHVPFPQDLPRSIPRCSCLLVAVTLTVDAGSLLLSPGILSSAPTPAALPPPLLGRQTELGPLQPRRGWPTSGSGPRQVRNALRRPLQRDSDERAINSETPGLCIVGGRYTRLWRSQ